MKLSPLAFFLLSALLSPESVDSRPTKSQRSGGIIRLPLKRLHNLERTDVHPLVLYQQHVNRGLQRIARMTRRAEPSKEELRSNIAKRMYIPPPTRLGSSSPSGSSGKRMYIGPYPSPATPSTNTSGKESRQHARDLLPNLLARINGVLGLKKGGKHHHNGGGTCNSDKTNCINPATGGNGNGTNPGVSQNELEAAKLGTVTKSDVPTSNGTTGLDIIANDVGYFSTVQIGTPPRPFKVIMDSGSSDFWVQAAQCTIKGSAQPCSAKHQSLGAGSSSTFVDTKKPFHVIYGTGAVNGTVVTDNVVLAGLSLPQHTFGTANIQTKEFGADDVVTDGLMGLAQGQLSNQRALTPIESLAKAGTIDAAITSFKISRLADGKNDGQVTIGGIDKSVIDPATLVNIPNVNPNGFWEGKIDAVTVNGVDTGLTNKTAILDTGTTLIIVPPADAAAVHAAIPGAKSDGQGGFVLPCTTTASVALTFGGEVFAIDPRDIVFLPVDANDPKGDCVSGISSGQIGGADQWLVGDVFLKNALFSTDEGTNTISLAKFAQVVAVANII